MVDSRTRRVVAWSDGIPLYYEYTAGLAGEAFLRGLSQGRLLASKCLMCGEVRLPARAYCLVCGGRTRFDIDVQHLGILAALSKVASTGAAFGYIKFAGVSGGVAHRVLRIDGRLPRTGDPVRAVFIPVDKRRGSILDIEGFRNATVRPRGND